MTMPPLPADWEDTRNTLQAYSKAVTAIPRAAGTPDPRWTHVAMYVDLVGLLTAPTPLADGTNLISTIDLRSHEIVIVAGDDAVHIDISSGPSSLSVGEAAVSLLEAVGCSVEFPSDQTCCGLTRWRPASLSNDPANMLRAIDQLLPSSAFMIWMALCSSSSLTTQTDSPPPTMPNVRSPRITSSMSFA